MTLARAQERAGVSGGICEIGVYQGKLFILLALLLRENEKALAIDLFEKSKCSMSARSEVASEG